MSRFPVHTLDSAPEQSRPQLLALKESVGMVPNLAAGMAESPALLQAFLAVRDIYHKGTLTGPEIQVLSLTAAYENGCSWCMAFHSMVARGEGVPPDVVTALRAGTSPNDPRYGPLSDLARAMVQGRGAVPDSVLQRFVDAGYTRAQALEVVMGMAFSLMANYSGHLVNPPCDLPLQGHAWHHAIVPVSSAEPAHLSTS